MACFATPYGLRYAAHCFNRAVAQNNRPALIPARGKLGVTSLRLIHELPAIECPFDARLERRLNEGRARIDAGLVNEADFDREHQGWSAEDVWKAIQTQLPLEPDLVVIHGDFSLDNVLIKDGGITGCIDVGGTGLADRYHDLAICWSDLAEYGAHAQERFLRRYGVGKGDQRKFQTYQLLNELF